MVNPVVFFDIAVDGKPLGRVSFEVRRVAAARRVGPSGERGRRPRGPGGRPPEERGGAAPFPDEGPFWEAGGGGQTKATGEGRPRPSGRARARTVSRWPPDGPLATRVRNAPEAVLPAPARGVSAASPSAGRRDSAPAAVRPCGPAQASSPPSGSVLAPRPASRRRDDALGEAGPCSLGRARVRGGRRVPGPGCGPVWDASQKPPTLRARDLVQVEGAGFLSTAPGWPRAPQPRGTDTASQSGRHYLSHLLAVKGPRGNLAGA